MGYKPGDDVAARMAEVVGAGPRILAVPDAEVDAESRRIVDEIRAAAGAGPTVEIPDYMRTMIKHPGIFRCQMEMGTVIFNGLIPKRERELAVMRIGWLCGAPYEWGEHVDIGKRYGVTDAEIAMVIEGAAAEGWNEHDRAILKAVDELLDNKAISGATWDILAKSWNEAQLLEFPMMVGQYVATAFIQNSVRIRLAEDNPGLTHR